MMGESLRRMQPKQNSEYQFRHYGYFNGNRCDNMGHKGQYLYELQDKAGLMDIDTPEDLKRCENLINRGFVSLPLMNDIEVKEYGLKNISSKSYSMCAATA